MACVARRCQLPIGRSELVGVLSLDKATRLHARGPERFQPGRVQTRSAGPSARRRARIRALGPPWFPVPRKANTRARGGEFEPAEIGWSPRPRAAAQDHQTGRSCLFSRARDGEFEPAETG